MASTVPKATYEQVLRVLHMADQRLRDRDAATIRDRLGITDVLGHGHDRVLASYYGNRLDAPAVAIATFIARCQYPGRPDLWDWCKEALRHADLDAESFATAASRLVSPGYVPWQTTPVATLSYFPASYTLVPLASLPYGHGPGRCGYAPPNGPLAREYQRTYDRYAERSLSAPLRVLNRLRRQAPSRDGSDTAREAWADIQRRVEVGALPACAGHLQVNWNVLNAAAMAIVRQMPSTRRNGVDKWAKNAQAAIDDHIASLRWTASPDVNPDDMSHVLREFFRHPLEWEPGNDYIANGQHRLCGMRAQRATHAFLVDLTEHHRLENLWDSTQPEQL